MTLQTQSIDIPLLGGINEALDDWMAEPGQSLTLTNVRNTKEGGYGHRYGTNAISRSVIGGGTLSAVVRLGSWNGELVASDGSSLYVYSEAAGSWAQADGDLWPCQLTEVPAGLGIQNRIYNWDMGRTSDGLVTLVWEGDESGGGYGAGAHYIYVSVIDPVSGAVVYEQKRLGTDAGYWPKLLTVGTKLCILFYDSTNVELELWTKTTGASAFTKTGQVGSTYAFPTVGTGCPFDACPLSGSSTHFALAYWQTGASDAVTVEKVVLATGAAASTVTSTISPGAANGYLMSVSADATNVWVFAATDDASKAYGTSVAVATWLENTATAAFGIGTINSRIAVVSDSARSRAILVINNLIGTSLSDPLVYIGAYQTNGSLVASGHIWYLTQGQLLTAPTISGTELRCWMVQYPFLSAVSTDVGLGSVQFATVDLATSFDASVIAQFAPAATLGRAVPRLVDTSSTSPLMCQRFASGIQYTNNDWTITTKTRELAGSKGVPVGCPVIVKADYADANLHQSVEFGNHLYLSPGNLFDGERVAENFFNSERSYTYAYKSGTGSLSTGYYQYITAHRWVSAQGRIMRMWQLPSASFTTSSGDGAVCNANVAPFPTQLQDADLTITTTRYPGLRHMVAEHYRTEANGTVYYLAKTSPLYKGQYDTFTDTLADATISSQRPLNTALAAPRFPPSLRSLVVWQNRVVGIGTDQQTIWISSEPADTELPWWNESFNVRVDGEVLTALGVLDDKLVAFSATSVYVILGQPADNTGSGNTLQAESVASEVGTDNPRSVVTTAEGIFFRGRDTFYLLDRALTVQPIGLLVQDLAADYPVVTSAVTNDHDREVRFTCQASSASTTGISIVYHLAQKEWTKRNYYDGVASRSSTALASQAVVGGVWYAGVAANGSVLEEDTTIATDANTFVAHSVETPFIKLNGLQGFQRIKRVQVLYRYQTACQMTVELFQDYDATTATQTKTWTAAEVNNTRARLMEHVATQKCEAMKIRISSVAATASTGTGFGVDFVGIRLEAGVKRGVGKQLAEAQKG